MSTKEYPRRYMHRCGAAVGACTFAVARSAVALKGAPFVAGALQVWQ